ncbi:type I methionyl aminopeptidase [Candidatus Acetothermia bacterium]|jgi:methionyl aminopeptidase|nr:type I methionyl aminopeptidase [Candidatus Acetothermia bacterium]MCI2427590.1 type I methionyl aminopeptidase [Candidatus Acetothermia bacterium]MCI2428202.1 type I methionyl aminopeptidase [Candidatus Acetothermia bacterium]
MIAVKTSGEMAVLRENGATLAAIVQRLRSKIKPGISTAYLDNIAAELIREQGAIAAFKGYRDFPATICASINEEIVHGIPSTKRVLRDGDIISIDIGLIRNGFYADMAITVPVGEVSLQARKLILITQAALSRGINQVKIGNRVSDISHAIGRCIEGAGFYPVKEYAGHGIGRELHEDPSIPNYGLPNQGGAMLRAGMVLALEPMAKTDSLPVRVMPDGWTVVTATRGLAAHCEHMVALTEDGVEVLTKIKFPKETSECK